MFSLSAPSFPLPWNPSRCSVLLYVLQGCLLAAVAAEAAAEAGHVVGGGGLPAARAPAPRPEGHTTVPVARLPAASVPSLALPLAQMTGWPLFIVAMAPVLC